MSDLAKVKLSQLCFSARFWLATFILFFTEQGFSLTEVYVAIGIYYIASLLLEYPTGVIGDYYSHRLSVGLGYAIMGVSYALFFIPGGAFYYIVLLLIAALGNALVSGSDTALLHSVSKDFKKDYADLSSTCLIVTFVAITVGGLVAVYDLRYPLLLSALALFLAAGCMVRLREYTFEKVQNKGVFSFGRDALQVIREDSRIPALILLGASVTGFFFSFKWFYNPIFEAIQLPLAWWGFAMGGVILFIAVGAKLYRHFSILSFPLLLILLVLSLAGSGWVDVPVIVGLGLTISHIVRGYFDTKLTVVMNEILPNQYRASLISLKGVILRIVSAIYIFMAAFVLNSLSLAILMTVGASTVFVGGFLCLWWYRQASLEKIST